MAQNIRHATFRVCKDSQNLESEKQADGTYTWEISGEKAENDLYVYVALFIKINFKESQGEFRVGGLYQNRHELQN